jgi:hypothetical protein
MEPLKRFAVLGQNNGRPELVQPCRRLRCRLLLQGSIDKPECVTIFG